MLPVSHDEINENNKRRFRNVETRKKKMGFIGRTKRSIWTGSPSLHPTYSNFYTFSSITDSHWADHYLHLEYIRTFIQLLNNMYFVHCSFAYHSKNNGGRWTDSFSQRICPNWFWLEPGTGQNQFSRFFVIVQQIYVMIRTRSKKYAHVQEILKEGLTYEEANKYVTW